MFEQKKAKQDEHYFLSLAGKSPEVGDTRAHNIHPHIFNFNRLMRISRAGERYIVNHNIRRKAWISLNDVTPSNKLPNYGNAAAERSIFWLNNNNLHAFVWVMEKVISGLSKSTWMPSKRQMK